LIFRSGSFEIDISISTGVEIGLDKELSESFIPVRQVSGESKLVLCDAEDGVQKIGFI
jgi:hypothetical protein